MDPSERVSLGTTRLTVTRPGLGTAPLGGLFAPVTDAEAQGTVKCAYDAGLRLFDTAPLYGYGKAEERLGRALRSWPRDEFVLATKVGRLLRADASPDPSQFYRGEPFYKVESPLNPVFGFSYDGVMWSVEETLARLGLDRVGILHIHDPDEHFDEALTGAYRALDRLRKDGTVAAVGVGMNQAEMLVRFAREADFDCFLLAGRYTVLDQTGLAALLPLCQERNISIIIEGVYNSGVLANPRAGATFDYVPASADIIEKAQRLEAVCRHHRVPLKAVVLQFPLGHPAIASVLIGCRSVAEVEENLRMFRMEIPAALWQELRKDGLIPEAAPVPGVEVRQQCGLWS